MMKMRADNEAPSIYSSNRGEVVIRKWRPKACEIKINESGKIQLSNIEISNKVLYLLKPKFEASRRVLKFSAAVKGRPVATISSCVGG
jgi:hypothetical protein